MTDQDRKNVIEFYEEQVWVPGMPKSLTEEKLKYLKTTLWFAQWMLATRYDECVNSIKVVLARIIPL